MDAPELLAAGLDMVVAYTPAECVARVRAVHGIVETAPLAVAPNGAPSPKRIKVSTERDVDVWYIVNNRWTKSLVSRTCKSDVRPKPSPRPRPPNSPRKLAG